MMTTAGNLGLYFTKMMDLLWCSKGTPFLFDFKAIALYNERKDVIPE